MGEKKINNGNYWFALLFNNISVLSQFLCDEPSTDWVSHINSAQEVRKHWPSADAIFSYSLALVGAVRLSSFPVSSIIFFKTMHRFSYFLKHPVCVFPFYILRPVFFSSDVVFGEHEGRKGEGRFNNTAVDQWSRLPRPDKDVVVFEQRYANSEG